MSLKAKIAKTDEDAEQNPTLTNALGQIEKAFGKGSIMKLSDKVSTMKISGIPTGALSLDLAMGGRYGPLSVLLIETESGLDIESAGIGEFARNAKKPAGLPP